MVAEASSPPRNKMCSGPSTQIGQNKITKYPKTIDYISFTIKVKHGEALNYSLDNYSYKTNQWILTVMADLQRH